MTQTAHEQLSIDIIAPNTRSYDLLSFAINNSSCSEFCRMADRELANLLILDLDPKTRGAWSSYYRHNPECLSIVLAEQLSEVEEILTEHEDARLIHIKKPINKPEFINILTRIHAGDCSALQLTSEYSGSEEKTVVVEPITSPESIKFPSISKTVTEGHTTQKHHYIREKWDDEPQKYVSICGDRADIDLSNPEQASEIKLDISNLLLGRILQLLRSDTTKHTQYRIRLDDRSWLNLHPQLHSVASNCSEHELLELGAVPLQLEIEEHSDQHAPDGDIYHSGLEQFLWQLALITYQGRLPADINLTQRVYLQHWPNLTRLTHIPNAMRIAALWSQQTLELGFTAQALKIPQRHVFAFYGAANAIGLAGQAKRQSDNMFAQTPVVNHSSHFLLQRLAFQIPHID